MEPVTISTGEIEKTATFSLRFTARCEIEISKRAAGGSVNRASVSVEAAVPAANIDDAGDTPIRLSLRAGSATTVVSDRAIMAANTLNSARAVQMSVFVVRAFLKMRALLADKPELAKKLAALEKELKQRLDVHEAAIVTILQRVMDVIDPSSLPPQPPKPRIGFKP